MSSLFKIINSAFFILSLALVASPFASAMTVDRHIVTDDPKTGTGCAVPSSKTAFSAADTGVYSWVLVSGATPVFDSVTWKWYGPDNSLYGSVTWQLNFSGSACNASKIDINGQPAANKTGQWRVEIYNGAALAATDTFTIGGLQQTTCTYTFSDWGPCQADGTQERTIISASPAGCVEWLPVLMQACTVGPAQCTYTYSDWSACRPDGTQTRSPLTVSPSGCTGTPVVSQQCTFAPAAPSQIGYTLEDGILTIAWKSVGGATGYKMGVGTSPGVYGGPYDLGNLTQLGPVSMAGVPAGTYYAAVKSYTGAKESAYSKEVAVYVPASKPKPRTDKGSVSLDSNREAYVPGDFFELTYQMAKGSLMGNVDIYLALGPTTGPVGGEILSGVVPLMSNVAPADARTTLLAMPFPVDIPFGAYGLYMVMVYAGADAANPLNWASSVSQLNLTYSALSPKQQELLASRGNPDYIAVFWIAEASMKKESWLYLSGTGAPVSFVFSNGELTSQDPVTGSSSGAGPKLDPALFSPQATPAALKAVLGEPTSVSSVDGVPDYQGMSYPSNLNVVFRNGKLISAWNAEP